MGGSSQKAVFSGDVDVRERMGVKRLFTLKSFLFAYFFFHDDFFRFANILNAQFNLKLIILKDETGNYPPPPLPGLTEIPPPSKQQNLLFIIKFFSKNDTKF